jgi:3-oxoacyl-(acyl-carrier-protein) synthase
LFPNTSPNLCASQCSIGFGLVGPCFAVDEAPSGSRHAVAVSAALVASGQCERLLLIALEQNDQPTSALFETAGWAPPEHGARAVLLGIADAETEGCSPDTELPDERGSNLFEWIDALGRPAGSRGEAGE